MLDRNGRAPNGLRLSPEMNKSRTIISLAKFKERLLADPEVKAEYDSPVEEFETSSPKL